MYNNQTHNHSIPCVDKDLFWYYLKSDQIYTNKGRVGVLISNEILADQLCISLHRHCRCLFNISAGREGRGRLEVVGDERMEDVQL